MAKLYPGSIKRVSVAFRSPAGAPVDPSAVRLRLRAPISGRETLLVYGEDAALIKSGVGDYYFDQLFDLPGRHNRRWEGDAAVGALAQPIFEEWEAVERSAFVYLFHATASGLTIAAPAFTAPALAEV